MIAGHLSRWVSNGQPYLLYAFVGVRLALEMAADRYRQHACRGCTRSSLAPGLAPGNVLFSFFALLVLLSEWAGMSISELQQHEPVVPLPTHTTFAVLLLSCAYTHHSGVHHPVLPCLCFLSLTSLLFTFWIHNLGFSYIRSVHSLVKYLPT